MIGHFLGSLNEAEENRVLTTPMLPGGITNGCLIRCVVGRYDMGGFYGSRQVLWWATGATGPFIGYQYDHLCRRFGTPRVNAAIRARILGNRLWRTLGSGRVVSHSGAKT